VAISDALPLEATIPVSHTQLYLGSS